MGAQGGAGTSDHGRTAPRTHRYQMVPRVGATIRLGGAVHRRAREIQRSGDGCTIPLHYRNLQHTENTALRSDGMRWGA